MKYLNFFFFFQRSGEGTLSWPNQARYQVSLQFSWQLKLLSNDLCGNYCLEMIQLGANQLA